MEKSACRLWWQRLSLTRTSRAARILLLSPGQVVTEQQFSSPCSFYLKPCVSTICELALEKTRYAWEGLSALLLCFNNSLNFQHLSIYSFQASENYRGTYIPQNLRWKHYHLLKALTAELRFISFSLTHCQWVPGTETLETILFRTNILGPSELHNITTPLSTEIKVML